MRCDHFRCELISQHGKGERVRTRSMLARLYHNPTRASANEKPVRRDAAHGSCFQFILRRLLRPLPLHPLRLRHPSLARLEGSWEVGLRHLSRQCRL